MVSGRETRTYGTDVTNSKDKKNSLKYRSNQKLNVRTGRQREFFTRITEERRKED